MSKNSLFVFCDSSASFFSFSAFIKVALFTALFLMVKQIYAVTCINPKEVCVEPGGTRIFNGVSVTLPCWRYETTWECHETSNNNCQVLREQGCSQTSARCLKMFGGTCAVQEETYDCPTTQKGIAKGVRIGDEFFCMGGDCSSVNPKSNKNFSKMSAYAQ
jgi:conjugal transfer mating pair stabilization protein TraN